MKKVFTKVILFIFLALAFTSCGNFLQGNAIKEELEKEISYSQSPFLNFSIKGNLKEGTSVPPINSYKSSYKVSDVEEISFTPTSEYQFLYWTATPENALKFGDRKALKTTIEFLGTNDGSEIILTPVCAERLYPVVSPDVTGGNKPKNTPIVISFNGHVIKNPETDLSSIKITIGGESILEHFDAPKFENDGRSILFSPNENILDFTTGTRIVTVSVPDIFYYETASGEKISMAEPFESSFTIDYTTSENAALTISLDDNNSGKLNRSGAITMYQNDIITVIFTMESNYDFYGWNVSLMEGDETIEERDGFVYLDSVPILQVLPNDDDYDEALNLSLNRFQRKYKVLCGSRFVRISPDCQLKKKINFTVNTDYGNTIPAGKVDKAYYNGDSLSLSYRENNDYQFVGWSAEVTAADDGEEVTEEDRTAVDKFLNANKMTLDTEFKVSGLTKNLNVVLKAETAKRPKVITQLPRYETSGVYKDRKIMVMFDKALDSESIYYTDKELFELGIIEEDESEECGYKPAEGYTLLNNDKGIYGYTTCTLPADPETAIGIVGPDDYVFKNIKITKRTNQNANLLAFYNAPYFDELDTSILYIDTKRGDNAPPGATDILVELNKDFFYTDSQSENKITLTSGNSWTYYTNGNVNLEPPKFSDDFKVTIKNKDGNDSFPIKHDYSTPGEAITPKTYIESDPINRIKKFFATDAKITLSGSFDKGASEFSEFKWSVYTVNSNLYPTSEGTLIASKLIEEKEFTKEGTSYKLTNYSIDLSNVLKEGTEGMYALRLFITDTNDNTVERKYYFVFDKKAPSNPSNISIERKKASEETVKWPKQSRLNINNIHIERYENGVKKAEYTQTYDNTNFTELNYNFTGLTKQVRYEYKIYSEDFLGNKSTSYSYTDTTPPAQLKIRYSEGRNGRVNIFYTTPGDTDYSYATISFGTASGYTEVLSGSDEKNKDLYRECTGGSNGTTYYYYLRTYDYSGNVSNYVYLEEMAGAMPGMICYAPGNSTGNIFCSKNYWSGKNPIGIVADGSNQSNVKILALDETRSYVYGPNNGKFCEDNVYGDNRKDITTSGNNTAYFNTTNGIDLYNAILKNNEYTDSYSNNSIWYYLKEVKNKNQAVTWWVPARHEWQYVCWNWKPMYSAIVTLHNNGVACAGMLTGDVYYVSTPAYNNWCCNFVGINYNNGGNMNVYLAWGEWMEMYTTGYENKVYSRNTNYGAYTRAMATINMN